eukprot:1970063-Pleurochrysis_carterae.AAC.1
MACRILLVETSAGFRACAETSSCIRESASAHIQQHVAARSGRCACVYQEGRAAAAQPYRRQQLDAGRGVRQRARRGDEGASARALAHARRAQVRSSCTAERALGAWRNESCYFKKRHGTLRSLRRADVNACNAWLVRNEADIAGTHLRTHGRSVSTPLTLASAGPIARDACASTVALGSLSKLLATPLSPRSMRLLFSSRKPFDC